MLTRKQEDCIIFSRANDCTHYFKGGKKIMKKREPIGYVYLAPALISMAVLSFFPIAMTVYYAFTNFNLNHMEDYKFVGFKNFVDIITGHLHLHLLQFLSILQWGFCLLCFLTTNL